MSKTRVRVESYASSDGDRDRDFNILMNKFRRTVAEVGVIRSFRARESYETPGRKRRRKDREADFVRLKARLNENFPKKS